MEFIMSKNFNNQFSPTLAHSLLVTPKSNPLTEVSKAFKDFGVIADNHNKKIYNFDRARIESSQKDALFDYDFGRKPIEDKQKDLSFQVKHDRIKSKVSDNSKLAKLMNSGLDYETFVKDNGEFENPTTIQNARNFSNKNKSLMNESDMNNQWLKISTNKDFFNSDNTFDYSKATKHVSDKVLRGDISQELGIKVIDGLHKHGKQGIYKPLENKTKEFNNYVPTEAMKAYRENLSFMTKEEKVEYRAKHPFIKFRDEYNETKKMSSGVSTTHLINSNINDFSKEFKIDDFSNYDFYNAVASGEIPPSRVADLQRVMANSKQAQILDGQMSKKAGSMGEIAGQARRFGTYSNSKDVDTNMFKAMVDEVETYIPGLEYSEAEIQNEEFRRDFLNITATLLKLQSGLTVSDKEAARFEQSMGSFDRNKNANFIGIKQKLEDIRSNFDGIKSIDPQYFNVKYGASIKGLDLSISIIDKAINRKKNLVAEIKKEDSPIGYSLKMNPFKIW